MLHVQDLPLLLQEVVVVERALLPGQLQVLEALLTIRCWQLFIPLPLLI